MLHVIAWELAAKVLTYPLKAVYQTGHTVTFLCKDTQCKHILNVTTMQLVANDCMVTAVAPLRKGNLMWGQYFW